MHESYLALPFSASLGLPSSASHALPCSPSLGQVDEYLLYFALEVEGEEQQLATDDNPTAEDPRVVAARVPPKRRGSSGFPGLTLIPMDREDGAHTVSFRALGLLAGHAYACWVSTHYAYEGWSSWSRKHAFVAAPPRQPPRKPQPPSALRAVDCTTVELLLPSALSVATDAEPSADTLLSSLAMAGGGDRDAAQSSAASSAPSDAGCSAADSYEVQMRPLSSFDSSAHWQAVNVMGSPSPGSLVLVTGLRPLRAYQLRLVGQNTIHASAPSEPTPPFLAGLDPSGLRRWLPLVLYISSSHHHPLSAPWHSL